MVIDYVALYAILWATDDYRGSVSILPRTAYAWSTIYIVNLNYLRIDCDGRVSILKKMLPS